MNIPQWLEVLTGEDAASMDALIRVTSMVLQVQEKAEADGPCSCAEPDCEVSVVGSACFLFREVLAPALSRSIIVTAALGDAEVMRVVADENPSLAHRLSGVER